MARDPFKYFRVEARELLEQLAQGILDLEKSERDPELVARLLRAAHTLKGAARVVKQKEIADAAHRVEDLIAPHREGTASIPREHIDSLLATLDVVRAQLAHLDAPATPTSAQVETPAAAPEEPALGGLTPGGLAPDPEDIDSLLEGVNEAHGSLAHLRGDVEAVARIRRRADLLSDLLRSPRAQTVRSIAAADELRELIVALERDLEASLTRVDRELIDVRESAERLRLLPARLIFHPLQRAVRDAARLLGKSVTFEAKGGDIRLEAQVLGLMQSALVQIAKNAVAHGIESDAARRAANKEVPGAIVLEIARRGHRVSFSCRDDGRGFDVDAVRRALEKKGIAPKELAALGEEELIRRLLGGGISTSSTLTEIAGRGVGLDVVRELAERIGGEVDFQTARGRGSTVTILVPASLSSLDALLVESGDRRAAIPLDAVRSTVNMRSQGIARTAEGESILYEGRSIPFGTLARSIRVEETPSLGGVPSAVIVESGGRRAAVGVDRLLGTENIVLKALPELAGADPIVAGAWLDGEGNPQIVVDPETLITALHRARPIAELAEKRTTPILVIDDSLTTRMLEQSILESAGYEVDVAVSGEDGLEKARRRTYALFLVDVEMPGMDGFTFIEKTRADPDLRITPAILVTSRNAPDDKKRGEEVGARAYIVKSEFDQTELLERIRRLVG